MSIDAWTAIAAVPIAAALVWLVIRMARTTPLPADDDTFDDPDRHRSSELPNLRRGWREGL